jgi:hypothetical protein
MHYLKVSDPSVVLGHWGTFTEAAAADAEKRNAFVPEGHGNGNSSRHARVRQVKDWITISARLVMLPARTVREFSGEAPPCAQGGRPQRCSPQSPEIYRSRDVSAHSVTMPTRGHARGGERIMDSTGALEEQAERQAQEVEWLLAGIRRPLLPEDKGRRRRAVDVAAREVKTS